MQSKIKILSANIAALTVLGFASSGWAQELDIAAPPVEEIITLGKLKSAADDVVIERMESEVVADIIDAETIGRIGDSTVAAALRRVPGVTLVDDKYVFVRGLGERYSTSLLNGAQIPSPDLTRSVIPLDIFPTSILKSVAVQKGYSADMPAAFSGGLIDIRTKGIPDDFVLTFELGSSFNTETDGDVLSYRGGSDDRWGSDDGTRSLSGRLSRALVDFQGNINPQDLLVGLNRDGQSHTLAEAQALNRELALELNRNTDVREEGRDMNLGGEVNVGNNFYFDNGMEIGFLVGGSYDNSWKNKNSRESSFGDPENQFSDRQESTYNVSITGNAVVGFRWYDDHNVQATLLHLANTDDKSTIRDYYGSSTLFNEGRGNRDYVIRYEERNLDVYQFNGEHRFGGVTRELLGLENAGFEWLDDLNVTWFYSDSDVNTEIPNETRVTYLTEVDANGAVLNQRLQASTSAADIRFTNLDDQVENYGYKVALPLYFDSVEVEFSGGYNYARKSRLYRQTQFSLGTSNLGFSQGATGLTSDIFSDANISDPANGFQVDLVGSNGESYLAAMINNAVFGAVDLRLGDAWRLTAGVRWEDYQQVGLPWNPYEYDGCQVTCDPVEIQQSVFKDDDYYPSFAATYSRPGFWAEDFQLRFNYSETVVRPDLREITPSSYIDPITGAFVSGNANVRPSSVSNYDLRGEWFFDNGDSFTASLFYKDIQAPIEFFESAAFEDALAAEIINAESAELYGVEIEWLKSLEFLGESFSSLFVAGNATVLDSNLVAGSDADAPTNLERPLAGASDYAFNAQLGWDSEDGKHSAMLIYNVFGERLYLAGRNGTPDAYEQPFNSVDLTYFWYPTDHSTIKFKVKNLLDESIEIEQQGVQTYVADVGTSLALEYRWAF